MNVFVKRVEGLDIACEAMRLSFNSEPAGEIITSAATGRALRLFDDDVKLLKKLIVSGDSHAKVTRMMSVWLDLDMPRYWWSEVDTYKQGTVAMSESTVHRLKSKIKSGNLTKADFETTSPSSEKIIDWVITELAVMANNGATISELKEALPESFLQRRIVWTNYQTLRHIYFDRRNHRLPIWHTFLDKLIEQLPFPEFITVEKEKNAD